MLPVIPICSFTKIRPFISKIKISALFVLLEIHNLSPNRFTDNDSNSLFSTSVGLELGSNAPIDGIDGRFAPDASAVGINTFFYEAVPAPTALLSPKISAASGRPTNEAVENCWNLSLTTSFLNTERKSVSPFVMTILLFV